MNLFKKNFLSLFLLFVVIDCTNGKDFDYQKKIDCEKSKYLFKVNKPSEHELSKEELVELTTIIFELKKSLNEEFIKTNDLESFDPSLTLTGRIYAHSENAFGHVGIGGIVQTGSQDLGYTIEAYPNVGVKLFTNRYQTYWKYFTTGGIYTVHGANSSQFLGAANWAETQKGKPYSLSPLDGDKAFYCSELVYRAWQNQGIAVGSFKNLVTPASIMNHPNTILLYPFTGK